MKYKIWYYVCCVSLIATACSNVNEKSLQGTWKPEVSELAKLLEAEVKKNESEAEGMDKAAMDMAKAMIPKMVEMMSQMRFEFKEGGKLVVKMPGFFGQKAGNTEGTWKLSEDAKTITLDGAQENMSKIYVVNNNKLLIKIEDSEESPLREIVLMRAN